MLRYSMVLEIEVDAANQTAAHVEGCKLTGITTSQRISAIERHRRSNP